MIDTAQENNATTPEEIRLYKEQLQTAFYQVLRFAFGLPNSAGALENLQKTVDTIPSDAAKVLNAKSIIDAALELKKAKEIDEATEQISFFQEYNTTNKTGVLETIPHLMSVIPREYLMPNHKLANEMTKDLVGAGRTSIRVSPEKAKKPVRIICDLAYDEKKIQLDSRQPLTEYDRNVYNAVTSLYVYGDPSHIVTPAMVYRTMTGMSGQETPSPQQIGAVTRSLNRLSCIRAQVDCTMELKARRVALNLEGQIKAGYFETYLLNTSGLRIEAGGKTLKAYRIEKPPILYSYSKALNQVISVPSHLLDIRAVDAKTGQIMDRIASTESRIAIKGYLLRRIEVMKNIKNKLQSRNISLLSYERNGRHHAGIYEIAGNVDPTREEARRIRDYVAAALDYWKAECYIRGYTWIKKGKKIVSVEIQL